MKKADIGGRVVARLRLGKAEAEAAVDTVFEAIGDSLTRDRGTADRWLLSIATENFPLLSIENFSLLACGRTCPFHLFHRASQRRLGSPARTSF